MKKPINDEERQQRSEKPEKRLVSRWEYLKLLGEDTSRITVCLSILSGSAFFFWISAGMFAFFHSLGTPSQFYFLPLLGTGAAVFLFVAFARAVIVTAGKIKEMKTVTCIPPRNAPLLPEESTLVRPSDLPSSYRQTELLRAVKPGQETPAEELLRSSGSGGAGETTGQNR